MLPWIFPLSLLIFFELVADYFAKEYSLKGGWIFWVLAILGYVIANIFWLSAIRNGSGLARGAILFSVGSAVVAVALGVLLFKEHVSPIQVVGCLLGIISLVLIFWE